MNNYYLIDFDSAGKYSLTGIDQLDSSDRVYIFYSESGETVSEGVRQDIIQSKAKIEGRKVKTPGKSAINFQMLTHLGIISTMDACERISIITKDGSVDSSILFLPKEEPRFLHKVNRYPSLWDARIDEEREFSPAEAAKRKQRCRLSDIFEELEKTVAKENT